MRKAAKVLQALYELHRAARRYDTSLWFQLGRAKQLHDRALFSLDEVLFWGLTDPAIPQRDLGRYLSREVIERIDRRVNDRAHRAKVDDKALFHELCARAALPVAKTYGVLRGDGGPAAKGDGALPPLDWSRVPDGALVAKPCWGGAGNSLFFLEKRGDELLLDQETHHRDAIGELLLARLTQNKDLELLVQKYKGRTDEILVQERLTPHPDLAALSGSGTLQSLRLLTFIDPGGQAHLLVSVFKLARQGNQIDNFVHGATGNLIARVDGESGRLEAVFAKTPSTIGLDRVTHHPDSGRDLEGVELPCWAEIRALAERSAQCFAETRLVGWDVALCSSGPVLVEGNTYSTSFPIGPANIPLSDSAWAELIA